MKHKPRWTIEQKIMADYPLWVVRLMTKSNDEKRAQRALNEIERRKRAGHE